MKIFVIKNKIKIGTISEDSKGNISFEYLPKINKDQYLVYCSYVSSGYSEMVTYLCYV